MTDKNEMTDKNTTILEDSDTPPEIAQIAKNTIQAENKHLLIKVSNINFYI